MPGQFLFVMTVTVVMLACFIRLVNSAGAFIVTSCALVLLVIGLYFATFIGKGSELLELSQELLKSRKTVCKTKYMRTFLRSCQPFKAKIGPFMTLEKSLMVAIISAIIDFTVTLLLI